MAYFPDPFMPFYLFAGVIATIIVFRLLRSLGQWQSNNQAEVLEKPARLVTKRQHVWGDHSHTDYYVTLEFEDKSRLEFKVKAGTYGLLAEGDQGTLTYQGTRFLDFKRD